METKNTTEHGAWYHGKGVRFFFISALILVCGIPLLMLDVLADDRRYYAESVGRDIAAGWGPEQHIEAPRVLVPYERALGLTSAETVWVEVPATAGVMDIDLQTEIRTKSIYQVPVYTGIVDGSFTVAESDAKWLQTQYGESLLFDKAIVLFEQTRLSGKENPIIQISGTTTPVEYGNPMYEYDSSSAWYVPIDLTEVFKVEATNVPVSYTFESRGSNQIQVAFDDNESMTLSMMSNWKDPSFQGTVLPEVQSLTDAGFIATWQLNALSGRVYASVDLFESVQSYTMVDRAIKHGLLFIALTFLALFMCEILAKIRVHPVSYLFIGVALAIFYLLLLALSEWLAFGIAYGIAAAMVVGLLGIYSSAVLQSTKRGLMIVALLTALYSYLYVLLQIEVGSLLLGTLLLFGVLSYVMISTRNVDWYGR